VVDWLKPHVLSSDPILRRRAMEIITHFGRQRADTLFLAFCLSQGEQFEIEEGAFLLARTQYPAINNQAYSALLDDFSGELRGRLNLNGTAGEILSTINAYLFGELKFTGNEQGFYDPQNSYLNRVLDRRTGNPLSLCLIYLLLAKRLRLPMTGIGLPGHFLCRFQTARDEIYVDAFNQGRLLTKSDCIKYLIQIRQCLDDGYLGPVSPRRILLRTCANLHQIYTQLARPAEMDRLQHYLVALAK
jgi:regulator of sirC expression with transglutaminase-like and TPR domain